ncbi:MAG: hypothetical protein ACREPM_08485, partial [Gemmatimonadaceae bacterium]
MRYSLALRRALAVAFVAAPSVALRAQTRPAAAEQAGAPKSADGKKILELEDYARWNRITSPALSADGKWMTFTYSPNEGGQTMLHVKALDGSKDYSVAVGGGAGGGRAGGGGGRGGGGGGNTPAFTEDSRWAAYMVTPQVRAGAGGAGRGGRGRGGAPARAAESGDASAVAHLELLNLASGEKVFLPNAASWKFSADSRWLAVKLNRAAAAATTDAAATGGGGRGGRGGGGGGGATGGADLVVRDMSSGVVRNIGNVNQFEFDDAGKLLAYTVE